MATISMTITDTQAARLYVALTDRFGAMPTAPQIRAWLVGYLKTVVRDYEAGQVYGQKNQDIDAEVW